MNTALWIAQALLAVIFLLSGVPIEAADVRQKEDIHVLAFRRAVEARELERVGDLLTEDVVFPQPHCVQAVLRPGDGGQDHQPGGHDSRGLHLPA